MSYIIFILGYDLLHDEIRDMVCDEAYDYCCGIASEFVHSDFYENYNYSLYDALRNFLIAEGYIN